jgi:hypothetical protein
VADGASTGTRAAEHAVVTGTVAIHVAQACVEVALTDLQPLQEGALVGKKGLGVGAWLDVGRLARPCPCSGQLTDTAATHRHTPANTSQVLTSTVCVPPHWRCDNLNCHALTAAVLAPYSMCGSLGYTHLQSRACAR